MNQNIQSKCVLITGAAKRIGRALALDFARDLLARGVRSTAHEANAEALQRIESASPVSAGDLDLLVDPQTSGGLLIGVALLEAPGAVDWL